MVPDMKVSVVIITRDEQPRLKLALIALARQTVAWQTDAEIIIVDDGSAVPVGPADFAATGPPPRVLRHEHSRGRSASRNAGAALARGRRLLFLDGDVLMSPRAVELHGQLRDDELGRGEQRHLRGTRFFRDPRTGEPWPGKEQRVRSMGDIRPHLVTEEMVATAPYEKLLERSEPAIYPGAAPRRLYELEMGALRAGSVPLAQWITASGHNFSIPAASFRDAGGFPLDISINEHRELALRLCRDGARVVPVEGAISLHLTHREGYRDPLVGEDGWEQAFSRRHPYETELMMRFWRSLAGDATLDPAERIPSLEHLDQLLRLRAAGSGAGGES
jgi:glycosyltransferase involved in cell wall biosynthesis